MIFESVMRMPAAWSSVCAGFAIHMFEGHVTLADMDQMQSVGERWNAQHPGKRIEVVLIFPSNARMTHEERSRMAKLIKSKDWSKTPLGPIEAWPQSLRTTVSLVQASNSPISSS